MNLKDLIGKRGEDIFAYLIGDWCDGRAWFLADFLDGKSETKDFTVNLVEPTAVEATFFVQVKGTTQGYSGKGANRKLRVTVTKEDVGKLKKVTGPAYVAGIDIAGKVGYMLAITARTPDKQLTGIPCLHKIDCTLIEKLWKEVDRYWRRRNMVAKKSLLS